MGPPGPVLFLALAVCPALAVEAAPLAAQASRQTIVPPAPETRRGDLLVGVGIHRSFDATFPLAGLSGDMWSLGRLTFAYGLGDRVLLEVAGDVWRVLNIERRSGPAVPLEPGVDDGTTADAGDFEISVAFTPLGAPRGLSGGALIGVKLPNSDERKGIGTNTTDVTLAALLSWGGERWRLGGLLGVGILEAPLEEFEQNDVLAYGVEGELDLATHGRLALGLEGRASTRDVVPLGTGDLAELRAAFEWRPREWGWDVAISRGLVGGAGEWSVGVGLSWARRRR